MVDKIDKRIIFLAALILVAVFMLFPVAMGTKTYPFAIVEGNSMYPNLQNGDLVVFQKASPLSITNGSIIVFVQGQTGISMIDSLIRPVVIHRVIDVIVQYDGVINYRTKGDNNQESDPELTQASQLLGVPLQVIPKVGLLLLFVRSSQGMVAIVGFITLLYLGNYESKIGDENKKIGFIGALANMSLNNVISDDLFKKLETAVKYSDDLNLDEVKDAYVKNLVQWIRNGGLDEKWRIEKVECPICLSSAVRIEAGEDGSLTICEKCEKKPKKINKELKDKIKRHMKLSENGSDLAIDEYMAEMRE
jgi:signal peptidase I